MKAYLSTILVLASLLAISPVSPVAQAWDEMGDTLIKGELRAEHDADIDGALNVDGTLAVGGAITSGGVAVPTSGAINNSMIISNAAIAYTKLNLSNSVVNADIKTNAAIAGSKLDLTTAAMVLGTNGTFSVIQVAGTNKLVFINGGVTNILDVDVDL